MFVRRVVVAAGWRFSHAVIASLRRRCFASYDRCGGVLLCVAWCSLSVTAVRRLAALFLQRTLFFGVSRDKCSLTVVAAVYRQRFGSFYGLQSRSLASHARIARLAVRKGV
jgi:hypothetical protein